MTDPIRPTDLNDTALHAARTAIENQLETMRDARISTMSTTGLVIREPDGTTSDTVRLTITDALRTGITTYLNTALELTPPPATPPDWPALTPDIVIEHLTIRNHDAQATWEPAPYPNHHTDITLAIRDARTRHTTTGQPHRVEVNGTTAWESP